MVMMQRKSVGRRLGRAELWPRRRGEMILLRHFDSLVVVVQLDDDPHRLLPIVERFDGHSERQVI